MALHPEDQRIARRLTLVAMGMLVFWAVLIGAVVAARR
jgi:hypothetical protein